MVARGRTASTAGAGASRSSSSSTGSSSSSTSSGSSSASTSSSSKGSTSSGAGAARSSRSSVSVSSPTASKTVTTTKTTAPATTTAPAKITTTTTATPKTAIPVSTDLARAITESQSKYPDAWESATGTTNIQQQFEQVTGTTIPVIEQEQEIEQFIPEILPEVFAEEEMQITAELIDGSDVLADDIQQILNDIDAGLVQVPDWFHNNIEWVQSGHITEQEFRTAYNYLIDAQIVHVAEPTTNETITNDMITQHLDHFTIENGRAKGQITFTLNDNFNPFYYGKDIVNIIQFKTKAGANILPFVKENRLRFTETERDEQIQYDESMQNNTVVDMESFVWLGTTRPTAFSSVLRSEIKEGQAATTTSEGFMAAGITGAIALLIGIGLILPERGRKK